MASVNDYGKAAGDRLSSPPLGGAGGWAEAVAKVVDESDETVDTRIAAAVAEHVAAPDPHTIYLTKAEADALYSPIGSGDPQAVESESQYYSAFGTLGAAPGDAVQVTIPLSGVLVEGGEHPFTLVDGAIVTSKAIAVQGSLIISYETATDGFSFHSVLPPTNLAIGDTLEAAAWIQYSTGRIYGLIIRSGATVTFPGWATAQPITPVNASARLSLQVLQYFPPPPTPENWGRWTGSQAEYDLLTEYDPNVLYVVVD